MTSDCESRRASYPRPLPEHVFFSNRAAVGNTDANGAYVLPRSCYHQCYHDSVVCTVYVTFKHNGNVCQHVYPQKDRRFQFAIEGFPFTVVWRMSSYSWDTLRGVSRHRTNDIYKTRLIARKPVT
jgi:hypothetical protein